MGISEMMLWFAFAIPMVAILAGVTLGALAIHHRSRLRELEYQERIARIERGLTPSSEPGAAPPASSPAYRPSLSARGPADPSVRFRSGGLALLAVGIGLMIMITFAGDAPGAGLGVGGAFMVLGAALLLNAYLIRADDIYRTGRSAEPPRAAFRGDQDREPPTTP